MQMRCDNTVLLSLLLDDFADAADVIDPKSVCCAKRGDDKCDGDTIAMLKQGAKTGTKQYLVPTMLAAETVAANAEKPGYYLAMVAAKARVVGPRLKESVKQAHQAGVNIAFGTDSGVSEHGQNAREFALLVGAGMTPTETLVSATITAAELLGLSAEIGTLEAGKAGDLIIVAADPTKDVGTLMDVKVVVKGGVVIKK